MMKVTICFLLCSSLWTGSHTTTFPGCLTDVTAQMVSAPSGDAGSDQFGDRIAIDGDILVGGGSGNHASSEHIYVFSRSSSGWAAYGHIESPNNAHDDAKVGAGYLAVDGHSTNPRIMAGTKHHGQPCYIFTRASSGAWGLEVSLDINLGSTKYRTDSHDTASTGIWRGDIRNWKVAIDGNTAVCASPRTKTEETNSNWQGRAWVFTYSGGSWGFEQVLEGRGGEGVSDYDFGYSVAIKDGTIVVGSPSISNPGEVYVFKKDGATWKSAAPIAAEKGGGRFGHSVAIGSATSIAATNPALVDGSGRGAVYVYTHGGSGWAQEFKHQSADAPAANYGFSVRMGSSGSRHDMIVTASGKVHGSSTLAGAVYWYTKTSGNWSQAAELTSAAAAGMSVVEANLGFGGSVGLSSTGVLVVGCTHKREQTGLGTVFAYPTACATPAPPPAGTTVAPGVASSADSKKPMTYVSTILLTIMAVLP